MLDIQLLAERFLESVTEELAPGNETGSGAGAGDLVNECFSQQAECGGDDSDNSLWYVGVIVSILGSVMSNFGVNTQKYSLIQEIRHGRNRAYVKQPIWVIGLLLVVFGAIFDFAALGFAAQSLITPVGGFTMVANLFFASYWLGEQITRLDLGSTMLIIFGIILVAAFADKSKQCFSLEDLICLYQRKQFIVYAVFISLTIVASLFAIKIVRKRVEEMKEQEMTASKLYSRYRMAYPLLCAFLSGIIGAQSVLFAKSSIEILKSVARGNNEFARFGTYLIVLCMFAAIFGQIHWLTVGLKEFDAVIMVPVFQCSFVLFTIIGGAAYFDEFRNFSHIQTVMFPLGVISLIIGVMGLALHESRTTEELLGADEALNKDEEEADLDGSLKHTDTMHSTQSGTTSWADESERRASFNRYEEFARLTPYGAALTGGRITPALLLFDEMQHQHIPLPHFPSLPHMPFRFRHHDDEDHESQNNAPKRRSSVPHRSPTPSMGLNDLEAGEGGLPSSFALTDQRSSRGQSFSGIQKLLNYGSTKRLDTEEDDEDDEEQQDQSDDEHDQLEKVSSPTNHRTKPRRKSSLKPLQEEDDSEQ